MECGLLYYSVDFLSGLYISVCICVHFSTVMTPYFAVVTRVLREFFLGHRVSWAGIVGQIQLGTAGCQTSSGRNSCVFYRATAFKVSTINNVSVRYYLPTKMLCIVECTWRICRWIGKIEEVRSLFCFCCNFRYVSLS